MSRKFSIAVLPLAFAAGLLVVGQTTHALQTAPAAEDHGAMSGHAMGRMTPESRLEDAHRRARPHCPTATLSATRY
jgi:hypothetical protein